MVFSGPSWLSFFESLICFFRVIVAGLVLEEPARYNYKEEERRERGKWRERVSERYTFRCTKLSFIALNVLRSFSSHEASDSLIQLEEEERGRRRRGLLTELL